MGTAERRRREKERRRAEIVEAAERLFFERGFDAPTVDDIAAGAELSKGTIYLYFKSKEEILSEIVFRAHLKLRDMFIEAVEGLDSGIEKVGAIGRAYVRFSEEEKGYFEAMFSYWGKRKMVQDPDDSPFTILVGAISEGIADGTIREDIDPMKTGLVLWGRSHGIIQLAYAFFDDFEGCFGISPDELIRYNFQETLKYLTKS